MFPSTLNADGVEGTVGKLDQIAEEIRTLTEQDKGLGKDLRKVERKLRASEKAISKVVKEAREVEKKVKKKTSRLTELKARTQATRESIAQLKEGLKSSLMELQKLGGGSPAKKILSPEDVADAQRQAYWFRYLTDLKQKQIIATQKAEKALLTLEDEQTGVLEELKALQDSLKQKKQVLNKARKENKALASRLKRKRGKGKKALAALKADQARLATLLERLKFAQAYPEFATDGKTPFHKLKGKLSWPAKGRVRSSAFSKGVTIAVPQGTKVRAISHGRVVYADWMRGFGLLTIIDHGDGYMSLYGRNESLYKRRGDWVEPGTVVAASGRSGAADAAGLYFEIRKNAQSLDPRKWCR
ncbi:MAG: murein hydrolase activator EnvC family protein [bacterium]